SPREFDEVTQLALRLAAALAPQPNGGLKFRRLPGFGSRLKGGRRRQIRLRRLGCFGGHRGAHRGQKILLRDGLQLQVAVLPAQQNPGAAAGTYAGSAAFRERNFATTTETKETGHCGIVTEVRRGRRIKLEGEPAAKELSYSLAVSGISGHSKSGELSITAPESMRILSPRAQMSSLSSRWNSRGARSGVAAAHIQT